MCLCYCCLFAFPDQQTGQKSIPAQGNLLIEMSFCVIGSGHLAIKPLTKMRKDTVEGTAMTSTTTHDLHQGRATVYSLPWERTQCINHYRDSNKNSMQPWGYSFLRNYLCIWQRTWSKIWNRCSFSWYSEHGTICLFFSEGSSTPEAHLWALISTVNKTDQS